MSVYLLTTNVFCPLVSHLKLLLTYVLMLIVNAIIIVGLAVYTTVINAAILITVNHC